MQFLVAAVAEGNLVVRGVAAGLPGFQMMHMELYALAVCAVALTALSVTMQDILPHIVTAQHFAPLVIFALWDRPPLLYSFQKLQVKFCGFHNNLGDRKQDAHHLYGGYMLYIPNVLRNT